MESTQKLLRIMENQPYELPESDVFKNKLIINYLIKNWKISEKIKKSNEIT